MRTLAGTTKVDDLVALPMALPNGRKARLEELGVVTDGAAEQRIFARLDGKAVLTFDIAHAKGASER